MTVHNTISEVYPRAENIALILIGDADLIREAVTKYGPVTDIPIPEPRFRVDYQ